MRQRNSNDDISGAVKRLCWESTIKAVISYEEACSRHRYEVVDDQSEHRCEDSGDLYYGSQNKTDYDWLIERLKRGV